VRREASFWSSTDGLSDQKCYEKVRTLKKSDGASYSGNLQIEGSEFLFINIFHMYFSLQVPVFMSFFLAFKGMTNTPIEIMQYGGL